MSATDSADPIVVKFEIRGTTYRVVTRPGVDESTYIEQLRGFDALGAERWDDADPVAVDYYGAPKVSVHEWVDAVTKASIERGRPSSQDFFEPLVRDAWEHHAKAVEVLERWDDWARSTLTSLGLTYDGRDQARERLTEVINGAAKVALALREVETLAGHAPLLHALVVNALEIDATTGEIVGTPCGTVDQVRAAIDALGIMIPRARKAGAPLPRNVTIFDREGGGR